MPVSSASPSAIASVVMGSLTGLSGVPIIKPPEVDVDEDPPHEARNDAPSVTPPVVITRLRRKSRLWICWFGMENVIEINIVSRVRSAK